MINRMNDVKLIRLIRLALRRNQSWDAFRKDIISLLGKATVGSSSLKLLIERILASDKVDGYDKLLVLFMGVSFLINNMSIMDINKGLARGLIGRDREIDGSLISGFNKVKRILNGLLRLQVLELEKVEGPKGVDQEVLISTVLELKEFWLLAYWLLRINPGSFTPAYDKGFVERIKPAQIWELKAEVLSNRWIPDVARRIYIKEIKAGGVIKQRPITMAGSRDKLVQTVVLLVLDMLIDVRLSNSVYGFRAKLGTQDALKAIKASEKWREVDYIIEMDIKACFDMIPHEGLMKEVEKLTSNSIILEIVRKALEAPYKEVGSDEAVYPKIGTPQGSIISPVLSNLFIRKFDVWCEGKGLVYNRYADDSLIGIKGTKEDALRLLEEVRQFSIDIGLPISDAKTVVTDWRETPVSYLGYKISLVNGKVKLDYVPGSRSAKVIENLESVKDTGELLKDVQAQLYGLMTYARMGRNWKMNLDGLILKFEAKFCDILQGIGNELRKERCSFIGKTKVVNPVDLGLLMEILEEAGLDTSGMMRLYDGYLSLEEVREEKMQQVIEKSVEHLRLVQDDDGYDILVKVTDQDESRILLEDLERLPSKAAAEKFEESAWIHNQDYTPREREEALKERLRVKVDSAAYNLARIWVCDTCDCIVEGELNWLSQAGMYQGKDGTLADLLRTFKGHRFVTLCDTCISADIEDIKETWSLGKVYTLEDHSPNIVEMPRVDELGDSIEEIGD